MGITAGMQVLNVQSRVIRTAEGILEEHRNIHRGAARGKAVVAQDLTSDMRSSYRHNILVGRNDRRADPGSAELRDGR